MNPIRIIFRRELASARTRQVVAGLRGYALDATDPVSVPR